MIGEVIGRMWFGVWVIRSWFGVCGIDEMFWRLDAGSKGWLEDRLMDIGGGLVFVL